MLTLGELKKLVKEPQMMKRVPALLTLRKMNVPIVVKEVLSEGTEIIVYKNGMVSYESDGHAAVFYLHTCGDYSYESSSLPNYRIHEKVFEDEKWYIRLMLEGEDQIQANIEKRDRVNTISYNAISEDWEALKVEDCLLSNLMKQETMEEIFCHLTANQKRIVSKKYLEQMKQRQISEYYGISPQGVSDAIRKAKRKLRSIYRLEDFF